MNAPHTQGIAELKDIYACPIPGPTERSQEPK